MKICLLQVGRIATHAELTLKQRGTLLSLLLNSALKQSESIDELTELLYRVTPHPDNRPQIRATLAQLQEKGFIEFEVSSPKLEDGYTAIGYLYLILNTESGLTAVGIASSLPSALSSLSKAAHVSQMSLICKHLYICNDPQSVLNQVQQFAVPVHKAGVWYKLNVAQFSCLEEYLSQVQ